MAKLRLTDQFSEDVATVWSKRLADRIVCVLRMLEVFPEAGTSRVPDSIGASFGNNVRLFSIPPFSIVYAYDAKSDVITVYGLVNQRRIR